MKKIFIALFLLMALCSCVGEENNSAPESEYAYEGSATVNSLRIESGNCFFLDRDITFTVNTEHSVIKSNGVYTLFGTESAIVKFETDAVKVLFDGVEKKSGDEIVLRSVTEITLEDAEGKFSRYTLVIRQNNNSLPIVHVETNGLPINSNELYVSGTVSVHSPVASQNLAPAAASLKVRGNSTRGFPKLSYRIKFDDGESMLDFGKARNWMLAANYTDKSLMRNMAALWLADRLERTSYALGIAPVEVWLNGDYIGVYTLADHIEVGSGRVEVETGSSYYDTGYFVEADVRAPEEDRPYFEVGGIPFSILSPENPTDEQISYITRIFERVYNMLITKNDKVWELLDMESCIDGLITKEICGGTSMPYDIYIYKDVGGKLTIGPVWDFDLAFGNADYGEADRYDRFYPSNGVWAREWMGFDSFKKAFFERWDFTLETVIPEMREQIWEYYDLMEYAAKDNFERWDILETYVWPNPEGVMNANTFRKQVEFLEEYMMLHIGWLDEQYGLMRNAEQ